MHSHQETAAAVGLSHRASALIAGFGLLVMAVSAPPAHFFFLAQSVVAGDPAATIGNLKADGTPYLIGVGLLFLTYTMDIFVAWALYWYLRPGQKELSQLVAWSRLVYTALAFVGLWSSLSAYDLATGGLLSGAAEDSAVEAAVLMHLAGAATMERMALALFGIHLLILSIVMWRSSHVPALLSVIMSLAGLSYLVTFLARYAAPDLDMGWVIFFGLGELVFMLWLLAWGWRSKLQRGA